MTDLIHIAGHGLRADLGCCDEPCILYLDRGSSPNTKPSALVVYPSDTDQGVDLGLVRSEKRPGGDHETP